MTAAMARSSRSVRRSCASSIVTTVTVLAAPNQLSFEVQDEPVRILKRGMGHQAAEGVDYGRIGAGHPERLFDAWANLCYRFAIAMHATDRRDTKRLADLTFPDITVGVEGVRRVKNCVRSADAGGVWVDYRCWNALRLRGGTSPAGADRAPSRQGTIAGECRRAEASP
jgi:hypothetical protein